MYHNIYLWGGSKAIADFWEQQREQGLSHVTITLKTTQRPFKEVVPDFAVNSLPNFKD